ncbi:WecB/TagA/CpsF family glycosyltransferase [Thauera sp. Sel9]|uniref:WecB/TagA/CpsF family glycosyltransferase n=1 Tax=Thauera sp. Sel9 TaxID=2974299 RepID=UPI0021E19735|nr:WecB/TagA/CpsF family glycosyltransferase [Thauera sp. Sel9]MCV2216237.1 WecB/TagA/CpsF family glycosyltransferase [Thauera sp. Sel9]
MSNLHHSFSRIGGWPHIAVTREQFAQIMLDDCIAARNSSGSLLPKLAFSMNAQALSLTRTDKVFERAMTEADYIQADGQSLVFASRYLSDTALPERIATTDFFHDAAKRAQREGLSFYILGASAEQNNKSIDTIRRLYPELKIAGHRHGYFDSSEEDEICREIVRSGADVLWVGLGKPKEQIFCIRNIEKLKGVGWIKTCGGLFDFLSGKNRRAPLWMQSAGLEWLHRMMLDPKRLIKRNVVTNSHAIYIMLTASK